MRTVVQKASQVVQKYFIMVQTSPKGTSLLHIVGETWVMLAQHRMKSSCMQG